MKFEAVTGSNDAMCRKTQSLNRIIHLLLKLFCRVSFLFHLNEPLIDNDLVIKC